jgi:DNA invertase Pin-like site-specific DNA recombinase
MQEEYRQATPKKCALYARSRAPKSGDQSTKSQIANCRTAARDLGWDVAEQLVFSDEGSDGREPIEQRPGLVALLTAVRSEPCPFNIVIVDKLSTFSRKIADVLGIYSTLSRFGVTVEVVSPSRKRQSPKSRRRKQRPQIPNTPG